MVEKFEDITGGWGGGGH